MGMHQFVGDIDKLERAQRRATKLCKDIRGKLSASRGVDQTVLEISTTRQRDNEKVSAYYERLERL